MLPPSMIRTSTLFKTETAIPKDRNYKRENRQPQQGCQVHSKNPFGPDLFVVTEGEM